jgi:transcriptional regulator of aromatic amino acid metabolism
MIQRAARLLIAIALLMAQQAALGHQIWHLGKQDSQPAQTLLCEQHQALSTVAGALDCATLDAPLVATVEAPLPIVARAVLPAPRLTAVSRSPPVLLS